MKFSIHPFVIDSKYAGELRNKIGLYQAETRTRKSVFLTMITTFGLQPNSHSTGLVQNDLTMEVLSTSPKPFAPLCENPLPGRQDLPRPESGFAQRIAKSGSSFWGFNFSQQPGLSG